MNTLNFNSEIKDITFTVLDTETTGLTHHKDDLVEIAAVKIVPPLNLDFSLYYSTLINPERPIPQEASNVHGITDDMVITAPSLYNVMSQLSSFIEGSVIIAHNAKFDIPFITKSFAKSKLKNIIVHVIDSVSLARKVYPELKSHSLDNLISYLNVSSPRNDGYRHRALFDADNTAIIVLQMLNQIQDMGIYTLGDLYEFLN